MKELFFGIWSTREHVCAHCGGNLGHDAKTWFFSHIVRRSRDKSRALDPDNIQLHCFKCHELFDQRSPKYNERKNMNVGKNCSGFGAACP